MPSSRNSNRSKTGVPGVKVLITAASLAATVGGWATISAQDNTSASTAQAIVPAPTSSVTTISIDLPPMPTLVPPPQQPIVNVNRKPVAQSSAGQSTVAQAAQPALPAGLRVVSAPTFSSGGGSSVGAAAPPPVTTTRSSR
jgi:hypothetical protein